MRNNNQSVPHDDSMLVFCHDCIFATDYEGNLYYCKNITGLSDVVFPYDFCSEGIRKRHDLD